MFGSTYGANLVKEKPCIIFFVLCFVCVWVGTCVGACANVCQCVELVLACSACMRVHV